MSRLARHYKRMLALYPKDHRERHGEEMLGVLLAAAGDRTRPQARETADLLWGAVRLHVRRIFAAEGEVSARDVLAVVSLLGPIALLAGATTALHELAWWVKAGSLGELPFWRQIPDAPVWLAWSVVAGLVLLRRRWPAAVGAWLATAGFVTVAVLTAMPWRWNTAEAGWVLLSVLTAVALTWSPGPARGRELVGARGIRVMVSAVAAAVALGAIGYGPGLFEWVWSLVLVAGAVAACGWRTRVGRRAALVITVPVMTLVLAQMSYELPFRLTTRTVEAAVFYGIPAVVLLSLLLVRRPRTLSRRAR